MMDINTLYYGDCLEWMKKWDKATVDLIYLDPPFNSNAEYNMLFSTESKDSQYRAFSDTWTWDAPAADRFAMYENSIGRAAHNVITGLHKFLGDSGMLAYLTYMAERLEEMQRLLKPTGSIYLHCDPTASHYLKMVMDEIFGKENFLNEIIWSYSKWTNAAKFFQKNHDVIFLYAGGGRHKFNKLYGEPTKRQEQLRQSGYNLGSKAGKKIVRIYDKDNKNVRAKLAAGAWKDREIYYVNAPNKNPLSDVWQVSALNGQARERLGYPTQKPVKLLENIIQASSNEGDVVLDPFCGCGTTIDAARRLKRQWVGIDISSFAIDLIRTKRLKSPNAPIHGIPFGMGSAKQLAKDSPFNFESWAISRLPGFIPNAKRVGDSGIDGRATLAVKPDTPPVRDPAHQYAVSKADFKLALAQVKSGKFSLSALRDFIHVLNRECAAVGVYITLEPVTSKEAKKETANMGKVVVGGLEYRRLQLWSINDFFENRLPRLPVMSDPYTGKALNQTDIFDRQYRFEDV